MIRADIETEVLTDKMKVDVKSRRRKIEYDIDLRIVA